MNNISHLSVFDFDETLFRMPGYTDRFSVERLNPDLSFPTPYSFYDHPSSMDPEIHNIQLIGPVYEDWKAAVHDPETRTILITHRTEELRPCAQRLLDMHGIKFNEMYFLGRRSEKIETLYTELEYFPEVREISIYEDSLEQLIKYQDFFFEYTWQARQPKQLAGALGLLPNPYTLNMNFVDKSKVIPLYNLGTGEARKIELI
jgi:hypothetical protein